MPLVVFYSFYTVFLYCIFFNKPFMNPLMTFDDFDTVKMKFVTPLLLSSGFSYLYFINCDYREHSWFRFCFNMVYYAIFVELLYYGYHRTVHKHPFFKLIHSKHHSKITTYPIDFLNSNTIDFMMYMLCLHVPTYIIHMNMNEYCIGIYFFTTMGFITHSNILTNNHLIHHRTMSCNYCLVFPIFDYYFDTFQYSDLRSDDRTVLQVLFENIGQCLEFISMNHPSFYKIKYFDDLLYVISDKKNEDDVNNNVNDSESSDDEEITGILNDVGSVSSEGDEGEGDEGESDEEEEDIVHSLSRKKSNPDDDTYIILDN